MKKQCYLKKMIWLGLVLLGSFSELSLAAEATEHDRLRQAARLKLQAGDKIEAAVLYYQALQQTNVDPKTRQEFARLLIEAEADNKEGEHSEILQAIENEMKNAQGVPVNF
jgi:hypothetical protein